MIASDLHRLAPIVVASLLQCAAESILLAAIVSALLRMVRRVNSSTRFAVWFILLLALAVLPVLGGLSVPSASGSTAAMVAPLITIPRSWAVYILVGWLALAGIGLLRVAAGLWRLRALRRRSALLVKLPPELDKLLREFRAVRRVDLCVSSEVQVPAAIGFFRPAVLIPCWLLEDLTAEDLHRVLIHELAHLRRWDDWTNLAQKLVRSVLFFHPVVWWLDHRLSLEREMACDDRVIAETANPHGYARCLALLAERSFVRRGLALAQGAVNRLRQTSRRVAEILDLNQTPTTRVSKPAVALVAVATIVCLAVQPYSPDWVVFGAKSDAAQFTASSNSKSAAKTGASETAAALSPRQHAAPVMSATGGRPGARQPAPVATRARQVISSSRTSVTENSEMAAIPHRLAPTTRTPALPQFLPAMDQPSNGPVASEEAVLVVWTDPEYGAVQQVQVFVLRLTVLHPKAADAAAKAKAI